MTIQELQAKLDALVAQVDKNEEVEASAALLLNRLAELLRQNANDPAAIQAIADGMSDQAGQLSTSATSLAEAIAANTPAE